MSSSTVSAATPTTHSFERRVNEVKPSKTDINSVIMDYLISEGYPSAAQKFAKEANIQPAVDAQSIEERVGIRNAIHKGNIQTAIERINELNPEILDLDSTLHFDLLRQQLVEIIRSCSSSPNANIQPALNFATSQLAPRASQNPEFLKDLERTMALLIFSPDSLGDDLATQFDFASRQKVASRVNEAILSNQGFRREARIKQLIRLRAWAEQKAREAKKDVPSNLGLGLDTEEDGSEEDEDETMHGNCDMDLMVS